MPKRYFELPRYQDLNKDQKQILKLPKNGQFLITGGPGTGKSVVSLLRAMKFNDEQSVFLTYNKVLLHSNIYLLNGHEIYAKTAHWWLGDLYRKYSNTKNSLPEIAPYDYDYNKIKSLFEDVYDKNINLDKLSIIVDEGQDLPVDYYDAIQSLGISNFFIVADQNQAITQFNSTITELRNVLALPSDKNEETNQKRSITLNDNYRNSTPIARFCQFFYTDKSTPPPKIPERPSAYRPKIIEFNNYYDTYELVLRLYDNHPTFLIGVIVATDAKREGFVSNLHKKEIILDNEKPNIYSYSSNHKQDVDIDFTQSGIVVLSDMSVKGLEFDIVVIIMADFKVIRGDVISMKKRLYVMASRAKEQLIILKAKTDQSETAQLLPKDEEIVQLEEI